MEKFCAFEAPGCCLGFPTLAKLRIGRKANLTFFFMFFRVQVVWCRVFLCISVTVWPDAEQVTGWCSDMLRCFRFAVAAQKLSNGFPHQTWSNQIFQPDLWCSISGSVTWKRQCHVQTDRSMIGPIGDDHWWWVISCDFFFDFQKIEFFRFRFADLCCHGGLWAGNQGGNSISCF